MSESPALEDVKVGDATYRYQAKQVENLALHTISHNTVKPPEPKMKDENAKYYYRRPIDMKRPVIVYVMEKGITLVEETQNNKQHPDVSVSS